MKNVNEQCMGCSACISICPKDALALEQDKYGFYKPVLRREKCIECGLCEKVCPIISEKWKTENIEVRAYACSNRNDEIRLQSSSGGVFYEVARSVLEEDGKVYGCAWTAPDRAEHIMIDSEDKLPLLLKSKYIQSKMGITYRLIKENLLKGDLVLFCGTPCQVSGLISFLGKRHTNLITIDFICHGVPSQRTLSIAKKELEKKYDKKIKEFNFRNKKNGWNTLTIEVLFEDNTKVLEKAKDNSYYQAFLLNLGLAKSCGECKYNVLPRTADITLGDFWGISVQTIEKFQDDKGVSCVVINTNEGRKVFENIKDKFVFREVKIAEIKEGNPFLNGHCKPHPKSEQYLEKINNFKGEYASVVKELLRPTKGEILREGSIYQLNKIKGKCKNLVLIVKKHYDIRKRLKKLYVKDFTIISNNCWGGMIYQKFGLKYLTPTIGLYILGHDFVKLCSEWERYFHAKLEFIPWEESTYYSKLKDMTPYPIARLGDIEIYFMHYKTEEEARKKWERRVKRINPKRMLFKLSQREGCSKEDIEKFMSLPLDNKLCFAYDQIPGTIYVPELKEFKGDEYPLITKYVEEVSILNRL